jgi:hypothetical protein
VTRSGLHQPVLLPAAAQPSLVFCSESFKQVFWETSNLARVTFERASVGFCDAIGAVELRGLCERGGQRWM